MTVLIAMRGFTTQNCKVAYRNERGGMRRHMVQEDKVPNQHHNGVFTGTTQHGNTIQPQQEVWPWHLLIDFAWGLQHPSKRRWKSFRRCTCAIYLSRTGRKTVGYFLEAAQPHSFRAFSHRLHCSTPMHCNSTKTKKSHTLLWQSHSKFNRDSEEGKQTPVHSCHQVRQEGPLDQRGTLLSEEELLTTATISRHFVNTAMCVATHELRAILLPSTWPSLNLPKNSVALGISSIHSALYKLLLLLGLSVLSKPSHSSTFCRRWTLKS